MSRVSGLGFSGVFCFCLVIDLGRSFITIVVGLKIWLFIVIVLVLSVCCLVIARATQCVYANSTNTYFFP